MKSLLAISSLLLVLAACNNKKSTDTSSPAEPATESRSLILRGGADRSSWDESRKAGRKSWTALGDAICLVFVAVSNREFAVNCASGISETDKVNKVFYRVVV